MSPAPGTEGGAPGQGAVAAARGASPAVVLVGFMGSGKSHVGSLVARALELPLVDTDALVVAEAGPIEAIFAEQGEDAFREIERRVVIDALASLATRPAVVSLGGGAVTDDVVRAALRAAPFVAWLDAPAEVLWRRVRRAARRGRGRPLARDKTSFFALHEQRTPLYREVASAEFRCADERSAAEVAELVVRRVRGDA